jgi:hypothetical protein
MAAEDQASPEETALLLEVATAIPGGEYLPMDRYRDFRKVFLGSDEGGRVLRQLFAWGHMFKTSFDKESGVTAFNEGERNMALRLLATISREPKERPAKANANPKKD